VNRGVKIVVLALVAAFVGCGIIGLLAMFIAARTASNLVKEGAEAATVAAEIADFDLPEGYESTFAVDIGGTKMVTLEDASDSDAPTIWMIESPRDIDDFDTLANTMASMTGAGTVDTSGLEEVERRVVEVRGQAGTVTVREGSSETGGDVKQVQLEFVGKSGPALVLVVGSGENWDQTAIDAFVDSIR
jgi:hypothetical protein